MKVFITYADNQFFMSQRQAVESAKQHGFDITIPYTKTDIDPEFYTNYKHILTQLRGAGYWLWKPYFIFRTLSTLANGDFLFYSDAGGMFINNVSYLIDDMENSGQDMMPFDLCEQAEKKWTKRDVFVYNACDEPLYTDTNICDAAFQLIKKSDFTMQFYEEYLKQSCMENLITDSSNIYGLQNYPEFIDHRHDQSIYSINVKKHKLLMFRTPSQYGVGFQEFYKYSNYPQIINHHRDRR